VILPSGYNNSDGKGYIFIVNPKTGGLLEAVPTATGSVDSPINMGEVRTFIPDYTDYTADAVYGADLRGNVWRWDLTGTSGNYSTATQIAALTNAAGNALPVTTKPLIGVDPTTKKRYLLVGTGRQLADSDVNTSSLQAMYVLVDGTGLPGGFYVNATLPSGYSFPIGRSNLVANSDLLAGIGANPSSPMGWYYDLTSAHSIAERIETDGDLNQGAAVFAANLPSGDVCTPRGTSRNFAVTYANGKSILLDNSGTVIASRTNSDGVATDSAIVNINGSLRYISGDSTGVVKNQPANLNSASGLTRLNWREISTVD
jgi:type IV pilus assembly protein PilY1